MAATRLIAMHQNKGRTLAQALKARIDYAQNPEKTQGRELVSAYECDPYTVEEEFLLSKRIYKEITGREQEGDIIAYQIRQSFKPGEVTPEEANRIGYELAMRFTKGKHAFIVATHDDKEHIHNHIIYNSTTLNCTRKFRDFFLCGRVLQKMSDGICIENGLSVIEPKPYRERQKRTDYPKSTTHREIIREQIDAILQQAPKDWKTFLERLKEAGYEVKEGSNPAVKGPGQSRYIRFSSLGEGYKESQIRSRLSGKEQLHLLIDIQQKLKEKKGIGYQRWATVYNLKQMGETLLFLRDEEIDSFEELYERSDAASAEFHRLNDQIHAIEKQMAENLALQKHIQNYAKTREVFDGYRQSGYSKTFFEEHRADLALRDAAKKAFADLKVDRLPTLADLRQEYADLIDQKKAEYAEYRIARKRMQKMQVARKHVELFYGRNMTKKVDEMER